MVRGMSPEVDLLTTKDAADLLDVAPITLATWRQENKGPRYVRVGDRNIRYRRADLAAYLEESTVEPEATG